MAGIVIGAIVGSVVSEAVGAVVADAVLGMVIESGITAAAADVLGASLATASFIGGATGLVAGGVANLAVQSLIGSNSPSSAQSALSSAQAQGILINSQSNVDPIPVIYGRRRVGGTRVFIEVSGSSNEYLHLVLVLSEGPVTAIDNVYLDDVLSSDAKFNGLITVTKHLGTPGEAADAALTADVPKWTSACKLSNCAYLYVKLKYDRNAFSGLPTITADVRGRTLFDPRDGQTRYSNNPALVLRDYLSNTIYGRGIASSAIDDTSIAAAANACDVRITAPSFSDIFTVSTTTEALTFSQPIPIDTGDGVKVSSTATLPSPLVAGLTYYAIKATDTSYQLATTLANAHAGVAIDLTSAGSGQHTLAQVNYAAYACDGTIDTNQTAYDNVRALLTACRGMLVFSGGKYRLVLDVATTASSFGFTESNITGSWVISQAGKRAKYNRVTAGFYNPAKKWQPDLAMVESTALRATDNGLILEAKIDLPFTANSYRAQNIGQLTLNQSRYGLVVKFSAFQEGLRCEVGDVVPITHSTPGWSAKLFRIMQIEIKDNDEVYVVAREYSASVYTQAVLLPAAVIAQSNLPDPFSVPAVSGLTLASGTSELLRLADGSVISRIRVGWNAPTEVYAQKGQVEVQTQATTDLGWSPVDIVAAELGVAWVSPVQDGASYNVRIRAINSIGVRGAWSQGTVQVVGKTAPPSDVPWLRLDGERLTWGPVSDIDLAGYRVRWQPGGSRSWSDALELHTGLLAVSPWDLVTIPYGAGQILIKAVDTTGNESLNVTAIACNLGDAPVENVFASYTLNTTPVVAPDSSRMWSNDTAQLWTNTTAVFLIPQYQAIFWTGSVTFTESGSLTIAATVSGYAWKITWKKSSDVAYVPFPGRAWADAGTTYQFRIDVDQSNLQGLIGSVVAQIDVPDKTIRLPDVVIASGGSRLSIGTGWRSVVIVSLTLHSDGGSATTARVVDKSITGPLIQCFNASGAATAGTVDAYVQGY
ncbi:phage tail protein [Limnohabitans sp.]|uniref:phage tail protein n=1 Tax=Limnohabitans sp. TaxID=1907725 RepID=UPI0038B87483